MIDHLTGIRAALDRLIDRHVADHRRLQRLADQLKTMPCCGRILAFTLIADMPGLGTLNRPRRSRTRRQGQRPAHQPTRHQGRPRPRRVLYMAVGGATHASRNPVKSRYQTLVARGKPAKLALAAVMRHMIVTLNAMTRDNKPWKP